MKKVRPPRTKGQRHVDNSAEQKRVPAGAKTELRFRDDAWLRAYGPPSGLYLVDVDHARRMGGFDDAA